MPCYIATKLSCKYQVWSHLAQMVSERVIPFTFTHLADAFIQSDLQCIQAIHLYCQYVCSLGIESTTFPLLTQCSTTEPQEHCAISAINLLFLLFTGVPISTQWGPQGYFYPIQIAQYGLSHYSKNLTEKPPDLKIYGLSEEKEGGSSPWVVSKGCTLSKIQDHGHFGFAHHFVTAGMNSL